MKTFLSIIVVLIFAFSFTRTSSAQSETTMQDILETVTSKIYELEDEKDQEVVNVTVDLLGGSNIKTVTRYLDPAFDYTVIAFGDRRISKLRLNVKKMDREEWEYVSEVTGSMPNIKVTPPDYILYSFTINVEEFKPDKSTGHFALLIYHKNPLKK